MSTFSEKLISIDFVAKQLEYGCLATLFLTRNSLINSSWLIEFYMFSFLFVKRYIDMRFTVVL
jgi:hypothetical protein